MQIFEYRFSTILWYFMIYSFIGWCIEVVYCTVKNGKVENRGFLDGPVCPVYGFGMLLIILLIRAAGYDNVADCPAPGLFFGGMILASSVELIAGWGLMKLFRMRWWNYSERPFNIGGYICLQFSICWGLGTLLAVRLIHVPLTKLIEGSFFSGPYCYPMQIVLVCIYAVDVFCTVRNIRGINRSLDRLEELNTNLGTLSEDLSQKIGERALAVDHRIEKVRAQRLILHSQLEAERRQLLQELEGSRFFGAARIFDIQRIRNNSRVKLLKELPEATVDGLNEMPE